MEKIGERLKNARELKKLTIKDISKETNISSKYLEALEAEEFDKIPGETYLLGFLRAYAEYLKLDGDEIIQGYKGYKIGESATPLEELTKPTRPIALLSLPNFISKYQNFLLIAGGIIVIIIAIWFFSGLLSDNVDPVNPENVATLEEEFSPAKSEQQNEKIRNLTLTDDKGYVLIYKNETVQFLVDDKEVMFSLKEISGDSAEIEILPGNKLESIEIEKPKNIKLEDSQREITFTLKGLTENRAKIFVMLGEKPDIAETAISEEKTDQSAASDVIAHNKKNLRIVFEAEFTRKSFFELYLDGTLKKKGLIHAGVKERWEANEYIQLKTGNAGGLRAIINGKEYSFGKPGQIANKTITWEKDANNPNLYHIVIRDW